MKFGKFLAIVGLGVAFSAQAKVIDTLAGGTGVLHPFSPMNLVSSGPISENGFTWASTAPSIYGNTGFQDLGANGTWDQLNSVSLVAGNDPAVSMTFTFDTATPSVLMFLNYLPGAGTPTLTALDENGQVVESIVLDISTPGALNAGERWGFMETSSSIKSVVLGGAQIVVTDLRTSGATLIGPVDPGTVPEPGSLLLAGTALAGLGGLRRKNRR